MLGRQLHNWTPPVLFNAMLFYVNRAIAGRGLFFSYSASALVGLVLVSELPERFIGTGLFLFAAILFEIGLRKRLTEFRTQAYILGILGAVATVAFHDYGVQPRPWIALAAALVICYASSLRLRSLGAEELDRQERAPLTWAGTALSALFAMMLLYRVVPFEYVSRVGALSPL